MIVEALCSLIFALVKGVLSLFPSLPAIDTSGIDSVMRALSVLDTFVSLRMISYCFVTVFIFMNIEVFWGVIMWVVRKIPGVE